MTVRGSLHKGADDGCVICQTDKQYAGMILRLTAADGEKTYTRIIEKSDLNTIFGLDTQKTYTAVTVNEPIQKVEPVTANVKSGTTLNKGDKVSLSCATPGAEIYYTTDMSCPCKTENPARTKYTGPIEINGDSTIIAYAVKDGVEDSKPTLFTFSVEEVMGDADGNGTFTISDVTYIQKYLAEMIEVDDATAAKWDYNHDGEVNITDASFMQRVLAELETF